MLMPAKPCIPARQIRYPLESWQQGTVAHAVWVTAPRLGAEWGPAGPARTSKDMVVDEAAELALWVHVNKAP